MKPNITIHDALTGETVTREMTDQEYADLLATGWADGPNLNEETPTE
jgi:hypothetical protein